MLYAGEAWTQTRRLVQAARAGGWAPQVFVASAGLGLRSVDTPSPSYAATFAPGELDSVVTARTEAAEWWGHLRHLPGSTEPARLRGSATLLVLSASYAHAMRADLQELARVGGDTLLVGGSQELPGLRRLPSDKQLRSALGGTATSLNLRMAIKWLQINGAGSLHSLVGRRAWDRWAQEVRVLDRFDRVALTDDELVKLIRRLVAELPGLSRSAALRELRDRGWACEQRRFAALFRTATEAALWQA
jgi:hypothetical protein